MSRQKPFTEELYYEKEDTVLTIGVIEDIAASIESIDNLDLPNEGDHVDADSIIGSLETDQGIIELYSPVEGTILEVNPLVLEDPSFIIQDPSEGWLFKVESEEGPDDEEEEEEELDDEDDEEIEDEEPEEEDEY